jgi:TfoX/Sxy family transcriptional regulator of competence genes
MAPKSAGSKTKKATSSDDIDPRFAPVVAALAKTPGVTTGKMMASWGIKVNGKIFAMMVRGKFVAKLPKDRVDELVASGAGSRFDPRRDGRVMKEWIELTGKEPPWIELAKEACRFVRGASRG